MLCTYQYHIAFKDVSKLLCYWIALRPVKVLIGNIRPLTFSFITATLYVLDIKRHNISSILYGGIEKFCPLRTYFTPRVMFFLLRYWTFLDKNYLNFLVKIFKSTYHKKCCIKTWYSSKSDSKCFNTSRSKIWPGGILYSQGAKGFSTKKRFLIVSGLSSSNLLSRLIFLGSILRIPIPYI